MTGQEIDIGGAYAIRPFNIEKILARGVRIARKDELTSLVMRQIDVSGPDWRKLIDDCVERDSSLRPKAQGEIVFSEGLELSGLRLRRRRYWRPYSRWAEWTYRETRRCALYSLRLAGRLLERSTLLKAGNIILPGGAVSGCFS